MSRRRRLSAGLALVLVLGGAIVTAAWFYARGSRQTRSGVVEVRGLRAPVRIGYDGWAIPVIEGATEIDVLRAQGFVHASERLWQLEIFQRIARGRLAEILGESAIETDRLLRTLDLWSAAGREQAALGPRERSLLDAYAEGVNERIRTWEGPWPPEFLVLGFEPEPWTARASLAIGRIMSLDLSGWRTELSRILATARLDSAHRRALAPRYPSWGPTILQEPPGERGAAAVARSDALTAAVALGPRARQDGPRTRGPDPLALVEGLGFHASNAWALGGSRTADGHPLLANDMHLALRAPSTWYLNALRSESGTAVAGLSIPGAPGVVVGLNRHLAWGFTNAMVDDADFVVERVDEDGSLYLAAEGWRPFEVREERIAVRDREEPVVVRVRSTVRGPVISDVVPAGGLTLSLLWTGHEEGGAAAALLDMNRAADPGAFETALAEFRSPHQNVIYATTSGDLGYRMGGTVPRRPEGEDGSMSIPAERLPEGWLSFLPGDSVPALRNPASDYLASANNLQGRGVFGRIGVDYPAPYRARRIVDRLRAATGWTPEDMRALQHDTYSLWAETLRPRIVAAARRAGEDALADELEAWDLRADLDARGPAAFYAWVYRLRQLIAGDEFVEGEGWFPDHAFMAVLESADSAWVDDARTPEAETLEALEESAAVTAAAFVGRPWGDVHLERSRHLLGPAALVDRALGLDVGPYPAPGGRHTVRPDDYGRRAPLDSTSWSYPATNEYGPSQRFVAHLLPDGPRGYFFLPTGQSGNPLDPHYRDMADLWTSERWVELSPGGRPDEPLSVLRLVPPAVR